MTPSIARIYKRVFSSEADANAFLEAVPVIESRLTAVDVKYRLYHCDNDPLVMFEIWEYPDEDAMEWVQSSMEGRPAVARGVTRAAARVNNPGKAPTAQNEK
ncbi:MAG: hypothetical protein ACON37_07965 [Candidatus Puniceispirillaceae bacterium]